MSLMALMAALNPIQTVKASESLPHGLLVVTIDCLPAWMLSAWGATWVATPSMDTLAARGIVLDRLITPSLDPRSSIEDLFGGFGKDSLFDIAAAAGWRTAILSDDPATPDRVALASGCGQSIDVWEVPAVATRSPAARNSETNLARLFSQAREVVVAGCARHLSHVLHRCRRPTSAAGCWSAIFYGRRLHQPRSRDGRSAGVCWAVNVA